MLKIYCNLLFKSFSKYIFRGFLCTAVLSLPMADLEAKNEIKNEVADLQTTQQSRKVSGVVLDTNNQPLVGATILQKGTSNGVITNLEGRFTIDLNGNAPVLEISYLGYVTETVKVGSRNTIKVILNEAAEQIDEVVVVGYGKSSVKRLTSAISTVKSVRWKDVLPEYLSKVPVESPVHCLLSLSVVAAILCMSLTGFLAQKPSLVYCLPVILSLFLF